MAGEAVSDVDLLFFDCDGVLLESAEIKTRAFAELFADRPDHVAAIVELHVREGGWSRYRKFDVIYRDIFDEPLSPELRAELGARYGALVLDRLRTCDLVPGAVEAVERWSGTVPCVVVSGSPQDELELVLDERGVAGHFAELVGSPSEKPVAIDRWLTAADVAPERAVLIGDAWSDLRAAAESGIRFVGRVPAGEPDPFPPGTVTVTDLRELDDALRRAAIPVLPETEGAPHVR